MKSEINQIANKLVKAYNTNTFINPIPVKYCKNINLANKVRKLCEDKVSDETIGIKAGGTGIQALKKLGEKEPFIAKIFKRRFLKSGQNVKIYKNTKGIEVEVYYLIKKSFFDFKGKVTKNNISKFIKFMGPCFEIVGFRQRNKQFNYLGDICSDFGFNIKFIVGKKIKFKKLNLNNLKTSLESKKNGLKVNGNTNIVYINPLNCLRFVLNKVKKEKINLNKDFYVFTGSTVGVVPFKGKGLYKGTIDKIGSVSVNIR